MGRRAPCACNPDVLGLVFQKLPSSDSPRASCTVGNRATFTVSSVDGQDADRLRFALPRGMPGGAMSSLTGMRASPSAAGLGRERQTVRVPAGVE